MRIKLNKKDLYLIKNNLSKEKEINFIGVNKFNHYKNRVIVKKIIKIKILKLL